MSEWYVEPILENNCQQIGKILDKYVKNWQ